MEHTRSRACTNKKEQDRIHEINAQALKAASPERDISHK